MIKRIIWIGILAGVLVYLVPMALSRLSLIFDRGINEAVSEDDDNSFLFPPVLDTLPTATNSAYLTVTGFAQNAEEVELLINDIEKEKTGVDSNDGSFHLSNVRLYEGENSITAVAYSTDGEPSKASDPVMISYQKEGPKLEIESPEDGKEFNGDQRKIDIVGKTDEKATVTMNERWVRVGKEGSFRHTLSLGDGENILQIVARDAAGNKTEVIRTVRYTP